MAEPASSAGELLFTLRSLLLSTPNNCTCTYLADHLDGVSHDVVNDFLTRRRLMPRQLWALVRDQVHDSADAFLILDDSVHDKRYSRFIELVRAQYTGDEHRVVKGIGVVSSGRARSCSIVGTPRPTT